MSAVEASHRPLAILLTGATGFVGRPLVAHLSGAGHRCTVLSRRPRQGAREVPEATVLGYDAAWPPVDAVINLAGESVVGLWTPRKRRRIMESRVQKRAT